MCFWHFPLTEEEKPFDTWIGKVLADLQWHFHVLNNSDIMHNMVNALCSVGDPYCQLNQVITCFAFLVHSASNLQCSIMSMCSPD